MEYKISQNRIKNTKTACTIVGIYTKKKMTDTASEIDSLSNGYLSKLIKRGTLKAKLGETTLLQDVPGIPCDAVLVVGLGEEKKLSHLNSQKLLTQMAKAVQQISLKSFSYFLDDADLEGEDTLWHVFQAVLSLESNAYQFKILKSSKTEKPLKKTIYFYAKTTKQKTLAELTLKEAKATTIGMASTRDLGNLPGNICTPSYLAKKAKTLAKDHKKIKTTILEEAAMKKLGMNALLSVSKGSKEPAKLITMHYQGNKKSVAPVVLLGKGITFDSGGISLKPGAAMDEMKYDMCGAATVFGVMEAVAHLQLPINLIGVVAGAENMPGGAASKPGDIVESMSGQTIEILNTDAEGRLVMCDALTYIEKFKPDAVIDIATLTGAMVVALGGHTTGAFTNHQPLADALVKAGNESYDRIWQFPLFEEYQSSLSSNFADMANIGKGGAGSITAACFLSRFTKQYHWAHLDIAGTAWVGGANKGATGRPVPAIMRYLLNRTHK